MNKYNITFCKNSIYRGCQNGQSKHMYKIRVAVERVNGPYFLFKYLRWTIPIED